MLPVKNIEPLITVVTINYNNCEGLRSTIESVVCQSYQGFQYLIIDGKSNDGSISLLESYSRYSIDVHISEDEGIYHAMNIAIDLAKGEWIIFMNSGDIFFDKTTLETIMQNKDHSVSVLYGDWIYKESRKLIKASHKELNVRHQSVIYRKSLHAVYGSYVVNANVTISDYIFFSSIQKENWLYINEPLSVCDQGGVSSAVRHFYQKISVDYIFGKRTKLQTVFILLIYPIYRSVKRFTRYVSLFWEK